MIDLASDTQTVKLTTARDGQVWLMPGCGRPQSIRMTVGEFAERRPACSAAVASLRVPGLARNADLLLALFRLHLVGKLGSLEVCGPWCCSPSAALADPAVLLYAARSFDVPISAGGWRKFDETDAAAFYFVAAANRGAKAIEVISLAAHPVGPLLGWIEGLDAASVARLLGLIIDPRWFVDPSEPDRTNKLSQFLGLDPAVQRSGPAAGSRGERNRLVLSCWKTTEPPELASLRPGQFPWRAWHARGGGWRGDLAGSRRFIGFLRQAWLAAVCRGGMASELLAPTKLFREDSEAQAFAAFLRDDL